MYDSVTPVTVARQAPLSMEFPRQEYWGGLPVPSPGDLPNTGMELRSPDLKADSLPSQPPQVRAEIRSKHKTFNSVSMYILTRQYHPTCL